MSHQITIENQRLKAVIDDAGAELVSLVDKQTGREIMWNGDAAFWGRHAPILFPNVGTNFQNSYQFDGKTYETKQHGFARDKMFTRVEVDAHAVIHRLVDDEQTRANYPFSFSLEVIHRLEGHTMAVVWRVSNTGDGVLPFTIGGHPAFALAAESNKADYALHFPGEDTLSYILIDHEKGGPDPKAVYDLSLDKGYCALDDAFFAKDARIFDGTQFDEVVLCHADHTPIVGISAPGFPNFGIWSVPGAPFVCLEPWVGRADDAGFSGDITEKPGILVAQPGDVFNAAYTIDIF